MQGWYTLWAPFYDAVVRPLFDRQRRISLSYLRAGKGRRVLINGMGTGLDFPLLPPQHVYVGLDLTRAMMDRARPKIGALNLTLIQGNAQILPFGDGVFDVVVLHLILAIVPDAAQCFQETARVLRPGGQVLVFDKFLRRTDRAWLRRALSRLTGKIMTKLDVNFEDALSCVPQLRLISDQPALAGGFFRLIRCEKTA